MWSNTDACVCIPLVAIRSGDYYMFEDYGVYEGLAPLEIPEEPPQDDSTQGMTVSEVRGNCGDSCTSVVYFSPPYLYICCCIKYSSIYSSCICMITGIGTCKCLWINREEEIWCYFDIWTLGWLSLSAVGQESTISNVLQLGRLYLLVVHSILQQHNKKENAFLSTASEVMNFNVWNCNCLMLGRFLSFSFKSTSFKLPVSSLPVSIPGTTFLFIHLCGRHLDQFKKKNFNLIGLRCWLRYTHIFRAYELPFKTLTLIIFCFLC